MQYFVCFEVACHHRSLTFIIQTLLGFICSLSTFITKTFNEGAWEHHFFVDYRLFFTADILSCHSRKSTVVVNAINNGFALFKPLFWVAVSRTIPQN